MYETYYQLRAEPFRLSPDHRFCYRHKSYARARAYMQYAFNQAEGFVMVTGRPGTGKTTLISDLTESLPASKVKVGTLVTTRLEPLDLLRMVAQVLGYDASGEEKAALLQGLTQGIQQELAAGRRVLLIIDEAQNLSPPALEELRLLTNLQAQGRPMMQIFLVGQEELRELVQGESMEQVYQRIVAACHLEPLTLDEVREYVLHRLKQAGWQGDPLLSEGLYPIIHRFSEGIPRRINLICGRLLLHGAVERRHRLGVADGAAVVAELHGEGLSRLQPQGDPLFEQPDHFEPPPKVPPPEAPPIEEMPAPSKEVESEAVPSIEMTPHVGSRPRARREPPAMPDAPAAKGRRRWGRWLALLLLLALVGGGVVAWRLGLIDLGGLSLFSRG